MKTTTTKTVENGIEKNVVSIYLNSEKDFNRLQDIIFASIDNLQTITGKDYNFVRFDWYVNNVKFYSTNNWIISEENKTAKQFFMMEAKKAQEHNGIKYIINPWLNDSFYICADGKYFYIDR